MDIQKLAYKDGCKYFSEVKKQLPEAVKKYRVPKLSKKDPPTSWSLDNWTKGY